MKISINFITGCLMLAVFSQVSAQQLPVMNHYLYNPYLYNPARTGQENFTKINFHFKKQWVNMPESPLTGILGIDARIPKSDMGVGAMFYVDQMHIISRIGGMASYAYHLPLSKKIPHRLSLGLSLGFIHQRFDFENATVGNTADLQLLQNSSEGLAFDFSAGINYKIHGLNLGISMMQGLNNGFLYMSSTNDNISFINSRHFLGNLSYRFVLGPKKNLYIEPSALIRFVPNAPVQVEGNLLFGWNNLLWFGGGYRSSNNRSSTSAVTITAGIDIKRHVFIGYTFELGVDNQLNSSLGAQHEFMVGVRLGGKNNTKELNKRIKLLEKRVEEDIKISRDTEEGLQRQIDSLGNIVNENSTKHDKIENKLQNQVEKLLHKEKEIISNEKEIEKLRELVKNHPLQYKKIGSLYFENGSHKISNDSKKILSVIKNVIEQENPSVKVYLYGNTCIKGDQDMNMTLSTKRTIAVRKELIRLGVQNEVIVLPMGEENPLQGINKNVNKNDRRVDVILGG